MTTTSYKVTGMSCEHCANAVTGELRRLDGVSAVTVDLVPDGVSLVTVTSAQPLARRHGQRGTRRGRRLPHRRRLTFCCAALRNARAGTRASGAVMVPWPGSRS